MRLTAGSRDLESATGVDPLGARTLRQAWRVTRFAVDVVRTGAGLLLANRDPRTRLSRRLGGRKVAAWSTPVDLLVVKRVAAALDATVNDVLLAVTAGALRRLLVDGGDKPHDLHVFVPVDLRGAGRCRRRSATGSASSSSGCRCVKRMFVRPEHRRRGHARRLLAALEERSARAQGYRRVVLETGLEQPEANRALRERRVLADSRASGTTRTRRCRGRSAATSDGHPRRTSVLQVFVVTV